MIRLHSTGLNDATILSNIFIDHFMPKANGEFVKVYIYLLRMLGRPEEAFGFPRWQTPCSVQKEISSAR